MGHSLVEDIVARIRTWKRPLDEFSEVESVESAVRRRHRRSGRSLGADNNRPGSSRHFGLLVTVEELAIHDEGDVDALLADLYVMVIEPHGTVADEWRRTWFRSLAPFAMLP